MKRVIINLDDGNSGGTIHEGVVSALAAAVEEPPYCIVAVRVFEDESGEKHVSAKIISG